MQTPTRGQQDQGPVMPAAPRSARREQDLIVIPEARPPRRWGPIAVAVAGALALLLVIGLVVFAVDQRQRADELDAQLTTALDDTRVLIDEAAASRERIAVLETRVAVLEGDLQRARQGNSVLSASRHEIRQQLRRARTELEAEQARFRAFMGPAIGDGTHVGKLVAVGANQSPARIVTDLGRWFTGAAATQAAIEDGVIGGGGSIHRYFRNEDVAWRTLPIDTFATVTVLRQGSRSSETITLAELQRISRSDSARAERIIRHPFSMTVVGGRITSLRELRYS